MRTQDRTYLQTLGFSDPDRKCDPHNDCCLYLSQPDKLHKIAGKLGHDGIDGEWSQWRQYTSADSNYYSKREFTHHRYGPDQKSVTAIVEVRSRPFRSYKLYQPQLNYALMQIQPNFQRIIGYADIMIPVNTWNGTQYEYRCVNQDELTQVTAANPTEFKKFLDSELSTEHPRKVSDNILIEVKYKFVHVATVIQQINTYKAFVPWTYVVCTMFPVDALYIQSLSDHGIHHISVSETNVAEFMNSQAKSTANDI